MRAIIVGHGPSVLGEKMGHIIDKHDVVIRLKRCQETLRLPEYYGSRTDIVGGSLTIAGELPRLKAEQYWVWVDSRHEGVTDFSRYYEHFSPHPLTIDKPLCDEWDAIYRGLRPNGIGHPHSSQGMKAILYACKFLEPDDLVLAGFDNIFTGEFTWSVTRGPDWDKYPDHNWKAEHDMIPLIEAHFGVDIGYLIPTEPMNDTIQ